jgi:PAS domain S-box-containing protein
MPEPPRRNALPLRVYVYVTCVTAAALLLLPLATLVDGEVGGWRAGLAAAALALLVAAAHRRPVAIGPRRKINVATAPEVAAALLLPGELTALAIVAGTVVGEAGVRARPVQRIFNTAIGALRAIAGGCGYALVHGLGPDALGDPAAAVAAAAVMYAVTSTLVVGIAAVQLWENPLRRARLSQLDIFLAEVALSLMGIMAGLAAANHLWTLALLVAPALIAQRGLHEAEARYRGIFDHAVEGIFQTGFDGRLQAVNPAAARMLGYASPEQIMAEAPDLRRLYVDPSRQDDYIRQMLTDGEVTNFEFEARRRDGSTLWLSLNARAVRVADGRIRDVEGLLTDISERKRGDHEREQLLERERQARAAAEAANQAKDEFLSLLSHELRTPLTPILAYTQILSRRTPDPETLARGLETIDRSARVQARLVGDLLDVSRIISGKLQLEREEVDLTFTIEAALTAVRPNAEAKSITITAEIDAAKGAPVVNGDPDRLQQVVWNLLSNAVKFTPEGGRVALRLTADRGEVVIRVTDTGHGIPAEFLPHVFERFRQADGSATRKSGGLGLGLAIVRHLVEQHGGNVAAESDGEGKGATFTVRLPLADASGPVKPAGVLPSVSGSDAGDAGHLSDLHVLVVEDDSDTRAAIAAMLAEAGANVTAVASSQEALSALEGAHPDVLLADIGLPDKDGYHLLSEVRARPPGAGGAIPAVAVTAYASGEDRRRALSVGFQEHLAKPIDPGSMVNALRRLTGREDEDPCRTALPQQNEQ